ncbi:alpha/beta hydrolase [Nocardioides daphniae]|uniref:Alpha/beta fold hydrolase n=1 Tax=Nocardioides daphniae TaxID=402297 RepID=A0A4P7UCD7_9ACTN|nr:alpha/beta fold hydrolase [Nocardioides daphniae]QCC76995.1 alpha/beta fold hydrolase [Nocardioides daphniae]GGD18434.1 carboxylesterase [Nocardioides daphniae]
MTEADLVAPLSLPARPELTGGRRVGVLVSHGFTGSPASVKPWAQSLADLGYAVEVPLLPGHGTSWRDLNTRRWEDWYGTVRESFDKLAAENEVVVVAGLSMGGGLVLRLAADLGDRVAGIILVNPAVATTRKDVLALPVVKHVLGALPGIANDIKKPGVREHGYDRTPLKAAHSMMQNWRPLRDALPQVTAPVLLIRSAVDHVVDPSSARIIRAGVSSPDVTELVLPDSFHVATLDNDAETINAESAAFVARVVAASRTEVGGAEA